MDVCLLCDFLNTVNLIYKNKSNVLFLYCTITFQSNILVSLISGSIYPVSFLKKIKQ